MDCLLLFVNCGLSLVVVCCWSFVGDVWLRSECCLVFVVGRRLLLIVRCLWFVACLMLFVAVRSVSPVDCHVLLCVGCWLLVVSWCC